MSGFLQAITPIIVALIGASHIWDRRKTNQRTQRVEDKQDIVIDKISTNSGKEPWQYLEMIAQISKDQKAIRVNQNAFLELLIEHTSQDATNFEQLRRELKKLAA